jgi:predicted Zn-dependent protease
VPLNRSQAKGLAWLAAAALLAFAAARGLPIAARRTPWPVERRLGRLFSPDLRACSDRPAATAALDRVTRRLFPLYPDDAGIPLSVRVVPGGTVNAFATLGGDVYVYDGLLQKAQSPEELAGVLAHEIEHVKRRHIVEAFAARLLTVGALRVALSGRGGAEIGGLLLKLSFSRKQEGEADEGGLARLRDARVDVAGFESFFARDPGGALPALLSDHPANSGRAELARRYRGGPVEPVLTPAEWAALRGICR